LTYYINLKLFLWCSYADVIAAERQDSWRFTLTFYPIFLKNGIFPLFLAHYLELKWLILCMTNLCEFCCWYENDSYICCALCFQIANDVIAN